MSVGVQNLFLSSSLPLQSLRFVLSIVFQPGRLPGKCKSLKSETFSLTIV